MTSRKRGPQVGRAESEPNVDIDGVHSSENRKKKTPKVPASPGSPGKLARQKAAHFFFEKLLTSPKTASHRKRPYDHRDSSNLTQRKVSGQEPGQASRGCLGNVTNSENVHTKVMSSSYGRTNDPKPIKEKPKAQSPCRIDPGIFVRYGSDEDQGQYDLDPCEHTEGKRLDLEVTGPPCKMAAEASGAVIVTDRVGALKKSGSTSRRQESIEKWVNSITPETQDTTTEGPDHDTDEQSPPASQTQGYACTVEQTQDPGRKCGSTPAHLPEDDLSLGAEARMMKCVAKEAVKEPGPSQKTHLTEAECNNNNVPAPDSTPGGTGAYNYNRRMSWRTKLAMLGLIRMDSVQSDVEVKQYETIEEVLQDRAGDPEVVLTNLGFGEQDSEDTSMRRVPERFLTSKSKAVGISIPTFLDLNPDLKQYVEAKGLDIAPDEKEPPRLSKTTFAKVAQTVTLLKKATKKMRPASQLFPGMSYIRNNIDDSILLHMDPVDYVAPSGDTFSSILHPDNCQYRAAQGLYENKENTDPALQDKGSKISGISSALQKRRGTLHRLHCTEPVEEEIVDSMTGNSSRPKPRMLGNPFARGPSPLPYPVTAEEGEKAQRPRKVARDSKGSPLPYPIFVSVSPSNSPFVTPHGSLDEQHAKDHGKVPPSIQLSGGEPEPTTPIVESGSFVTSNVCDDNNNDDMPGPQRHLTLQKIPTISVTPSFDMDECDRPQELTKAHSGPITIYEDLPQGCDQNANEIHDYAKEVTDYTTQLAKLSQSTICDTESRSLHSSVNVCDKDNINGDTVKTSLDSYSKSGHGGSTRLQHHSPGGSTGLDVTSTAKLLKPSLEEMGIVQQSFELEEILSGDIATDDLSHGKDKPKEKAGLLRGGSIQSDSSGFAESLDPIDAHRDPRRDDPDPQGVNKILSKISAQTAQSISKEQGAPDDPSAPRASTWKAVSERLTETLETPRSEPGEMAGYIQMYENSPQNEVEKFRIEGSRRLRSDVTDISVQAGGDLDTVPETSVGNLWQVDFDLNASTPSLASESPGGRKSLQDHSGEGLRYPKEQDPWMHGNNKNDAVRSLADLLSSQGDATDDELVQIYGQSMQNTEQDVMLVSQSEHREAELDQKPPVKSKEAAEFGELLSRHMSENDRHMSETDGHMSETDGHMSETDGHMSERDDKGNVVFIKYLSSASSSDTESSSSDAKKNKRKPGSMKRKPAVRIKGPPSDKADNDRSGGHFPGIPTIKVDPANDSDVFESIPDGATCTGTTQNDEPSGSQPPERAIEGSPKRMKKAKKPKKESKAKHRKPSALEALARTTLASSFEFSHVDSSDKLASDSMGSVSEKPGLRMPDPVESMRCPDPRDAPTKIIDDPLADHQVSPSNSCEENSSLIGRNQSHTDPGRRTSYDTKRPSFLMTDYDVLVELVASANQTEDSMDESDVYDDAHSFDPFGSADRLGVTDSELSMRTAQSEQYVGEYSGTSNQKRSTSESSQNSDDDHHATDASLLRERFLEQITSGDDSQAEKTRQRSSWPIEANVKVRYQESPSSSDIGNQDSPAEDKIPQRDDMWRSTLTLSDMKYLDNLAIALAVPAAVSSQTQDDEKEKSVRMSQRSNSADLISEMGLKVRKEKSGGKSDSSPISKFMKSILHPKSKNSGVKPEKSQAGSSLKKSETIGTADDLKHRQDKNGGKSVSKLSKPALLQKRRKNRSRSEPGKLNKEQIQKLSSGSKKKERTDSKGLPNWLKSILHSPKSKADKTSKEESFVSADESQLEKQSKVPDPDGQHGTEELRGLPQVALSNLSLPPDEARPPSSQSEASSRWGVTDSDAEDLPESPPDTGALAALAAQTAAANARIVSTMSQPKRTNISIAHRGPIVSHLEVNLQQKTPSQHGQASHKSEVLLVLGDGVVKEIKQLTPPQEKKEEKFALPGGFGSSAGEVHSKERYKNCPAVDQDAMDQRRGLTADKPSRRHPLDPRARRRRGRRNKDTDIAIEALSDDVFDRDTNGQGHNTNSKDSHKDRKISEVRLSLTETDLNSITVVPTGPLEHPSNFAGNLPKGAYYIPYTSAGALPGDFQGYNNQPSGFIPLYATPAGYVLSSPVLASDHVGSCPFQSQGLLAGCSITSSGFQPILHQAQSDSCFTAGRAQTSTGSIPQGTALEEACQHKILSNMMKATSLTDLPIEKLLGEAPSWSVTKPSGDIRQHLLNEVKLLQHAVHKYKLEFRALEIRITSDYLAVGQHLAPEDKAALDSLSLLRSEIRQELSIMEDLLETRLRGIISGSPNMAKSLPVDLSSLRIIQQMIELLKEQVYHNNIAMTIHDARTSATPASELSQDIEQHDQHMAPPSTKSLMQQLAMLQQQIESQQVTTATILGSQLKELKDTLVEEIRHSVYAETQQLRLQVQSAESKLAHIKPTDGESAASGAASARGNTSRDRTSVLTTTGTRTQPLAPEGTGAKGQPSALPRADTAESPASAVCLRKKDPTRMKEETSSHRLSLKEEMDLVNGAAGSQGVMPDTGGVGGDNQGKSVKKVMLDKSTEELFV